MITALAVRRLILIAGLAIATIFSTLPVFAQDQAQQPIRSEQLPPPATSLQVQPPVTPQQAQQPATTGCYSDEASERAKYEGCPGNLPSLTPPPQKTRQGQ